MAEKRTFNKLPEIFRTNTLDKFFKSTVDQWFAEAQTIQISGYIGRKNPGTFKPNTDFYLPEIDHTRQNYQLEPTLVNKDVDTADVSNALFYDDTLKILSVEGSNIDNHHRLFKSKAYSWAPPIDLDKFVNYENYFWYEPAELITFNIVAGNTFINITSDIIGQKNYTSYHGIKFTNGLKVRFTGSNIAPQGFLNKDWIVRGVGNKIELLDTTDTILNNTQQYTATNITDRIDYVTIERGSVNHNPWSRTNGWYHKDVLLRGTGTSTGETYTDIVDNQWDKVGDDWDEETWDATVTQKSAIFTLDSTRQAIRPIIEFDHNLELYNYGLESVGTVTHASVVTHDNIQNGVNIKIDGITVATDDTIIFLNATNLLNYIPWDGEKLVNPATGETEGQWDSKAWDIEADPGAYQLGKIYKATILNGVCTLTEIKNILEKQKVLVLKGENLTGSEYHWDSNDWALSQQKTKTTDEPLFQLYDNDKVKLQDVGIYPSSTFVGNPIFSYDEGTGTTDTVIGKALTYKEFGQVADIVFKNNLEDTITYSNGDIIGYKYLKHYDLNKEIGAVLFVDTFDLVEATRSYAQLHGQLVSLVGNIDGITPVAGKTVILFNNTQNYNAARWDIYEWDDDIAPPTGGEPWDTTTNLPLLLGQTGIYTVSIDSSEGIDRFMLTLTTTINHGDYVTIRDGIIYSNNDLLWQTSAWADVTFKIPPEIRQQNTYNNAWNTSGDFNKQRVIERYVSTVDGTQDYNLQTTPVTNSPTDIIVTVDGELAKQSTSSTAYDYYVTADNTLTFTTNKVLSKDQLIEVRSFTKDAVNLNDIHYFEIPDSLEANPDNKEIVSASASELLGHFTSIIENQIDLTGTAYGVNNYRDTLKDRSIGNKILQHESTLLPLMNIIANDNFRVLDAIRFNQRNYVNFKNKFLQRAEFLVTRHLTTPIDTFVDIILEDMYSKRSNLKVYQDTNVLAFGKNYTTTDVTALFNSDYIDLTTQITPALTDRSKIVYVYRKKWASTDYVLLRNVSDYLFSSTTTSTGSIVTRITFTDPLQKDDLIQIRVFENIQNSFIPPTPSSLGMYQVYPPRTESDNTYFTGTKNFIVGHDGSRILMYGDYRDQCLLELEKRIYNAIPDKFISADYIPEINQYDYVPGKFRDNDYSLYEFNRVLEPVYQRWSIENKVDTFTHRDYDESSPFTWNYNKEPDNDGKEVPGGWRGIFLYYYDTHRPHTHPWEMLGFTIKPSWWEATYGPVIKSNTSLWNDLENGIIRHGNRENFLDNSYLTNNPFRRTGLSNYIPVDESGNLLDPVKAGIFGDPTTLVVDGNYSTPYGPDRDNPWTFGDWGPAEFSIRLNSVWPFIINKLAFLTRPAEWATKNWDTLNIARALTDKKQIIFNDTKKRNQIATLRYHQVKLLETSPNVEYVFGYQQWIYNLLVNNGIDYDKGFATNMKTAEVNLAYKVGGFVSNDSISIQADTYSTTRDSDSIFLPTEDKTIKIYNGASEGIRSYSGVIIEITPTGYAVYGYDPYNPVFRIIPSITTGPKKDVVIEDYSVKEYTTHYDVVAEVEYGFEFSSIQEVFDFLISYQRYLTAVGFVFDEFDADIGESLDFRHAGKEFIFWARITAWDYGAFIAVSPAANKIKLNVSTLGRISSLTEIINGTYSVLNKNGLAIPMSNLHINRGPENFTITSLDGTGIFGFKVNTFKSEHIILLNNTTGFNDLVYDPVLRLRQDRLKLNLTKTADWTGEVEAKGYIVRDNTIIPNFDTTANDYRKFFNDRDAIVSKAQRDSARHLIGYQHRDYLTNITGNDDTSYEFYKGFIRQKGTKESIKRLLRNTNVTSDSEFTFYEEFALKVGDFGATRITTDNEIQIKANDVKVQNPLIEFTFEAESVDTIIDDVIQINHINDTRWLRKPKTELTTVWPIGALGYKELDALPDAGPVHGDDTTYKAYDNTILAGLNTISMAPAEPAQNSIAHVAQSPNNEFAVYKLIDSGLRPEIITSVPDSTLFSEVNVTGQEIPTIVGSQVIPTTNVGDTLEFTFDGDPASKTTVTVTTVEAAAVDDPLKIPELTLELKSDVTSIAVNDSIFINTSNTGAGTEVAFTTAPTNKSVVVIGLQELPKIVRGAPKVDITGGNGSGAQIKVTVTGDDKVISAMSIVEAGDNYTAESTLTVEASPTSVGATPDLTQSTATSKYNATLTFGTVHNSLGFTQKVTVAADEILTQAVTSATGRVISNTSNGTAVDLTDITGTFNTTNAITASASGILGDIILQLNNQVTVAVDDTITSDGGGSGTVRFQGTDVTEITLYNVTSGFITGDLLSANASSLSSNVQTVYHATKIQLDLAMGSNFAQGERVTEYNASNEEIATGVVTHVETSLIYVINVDGDGTFTDNATHYLTGSDVGTTTKYIDEFLPVTSFTTMRSINGGGISSVNITNAGSGYNEGTLVINDTTLIFYNNDTLTSGTGDGLGNSTILEKLNSVPNVTATLHDNKIKLSTLNQTLVIADQGTGIGRELGFEEGTFHWDLTMDQIMADIITADVPSLSITKVSDVKLKLISSTSNLSVSKGIGPAIDRLLLTNKNGFEVTKIDTSRVTIDTIIADINSTIIKEDFKASKTSIGTLQIEFNGDSLEVGGTGLSGLGISAQTSSLQASSVAQHMFEDGDVVILNNVLNLDGSASELGGGYKISTISETHSLNVKIVNGSILITNLKTNEITALSDVNSIPLYDIVGADRDYIKHLSLTILSTIAPTQITVGDTIDIDSILTTMHGGVGKYYGAEKLYSTLTGNIIVKTVGTGNFTHGEFTINFTVEKKGKFYIIGQNIDVCNSASNILWWKKRNVKTKDELFQDVKTNQSHYALNDLGWVENKPNGWLVEQYIDNKEHYGVSTFALGSGGDNYIAADIGAILTYTVDETNTKTAPTAQIDSIAYALSNVTITNSGAGYTSPPNVTFTGGTPSIIGTGLAILSSAITGVTITNSGAGYQQVPNVEIVTSPGATATVRMQLDDAIGNSESSDTCSGIRIKNGGTGYTQGDTIVIAGGTETTKASATVSSIGSGGVITGLSQTSNNYLAMGDYIVLPNCIDNESEGGTGSGLLVDLLWNIKSLSISEDTNNDFQVAPDLNIDAPTNASGCTTLVTAQATANLVGIVSRVDIINRGAGYITIPTLTFSGGGGISAAGTTSLAGPVSSISIKDAGDLTIQPSTINVPTISTTTGTGVTLTATYQNITNFNTWFKTYRQEEKPILSKLFNVGILYDKSDHTVDATMQLLDPRKGIISGLADTEIYYKLERDPARYNNSDLDTFLFDTDEMWGEEQIGRIWWNLSTVRFLNAEQGNNRYRRENWNKVFPGSTIDIYEWTSDTVIPTAYKGTGTVLNTNRYVLKEVWNNSINNFISTYFFWVKNKTDVPSVEARSRSAIDVKNYIEIPTKQGINWYAPISSNYEWTEEIIIINTELTQTIGQSVTAADIAGVTLNGVKVKWSMGVLDDDGKMITINLLVAPTINDALRISYSRPGGALIVNNIDHLLTHEDSVLQLRYNTQATENNVHKQWILLRPDDPRSEIPSKFIDKMIDSLIGYDKTGLVIPDTTILNEIERQGTLTRPRQTWFKDLKTARKEFVYYINNIIKTFALDDERIAWDTNISSALIETLDWYAIKESTTNDEGIVTNVYWDADTAIISYTVQTVTKRNELTGIVNNDIVKVSNAGNNRWKLYQFSTAGEWIVIGSEKATRKISESVYNLDLTLAQTTELRTIIESFIDNVFIKEWTVEINKMFFNMINYVLVEQPETDWIFKSTYATTTVAENDVQQKSKWKVDLLPSTEEYINEVKPYSTKIREFIGVKNIKLDQANTHTTDFDNPPYKDTLGIFGTQNAIVPLYPSTTDHLPTLQSGIYSDYFANRTNNSLVRAITIKMYFDRIHSSIEEVKTYNSGNTSAAGVDGRAYRHTAVKTTTQRESALLNSIVNATSVGESSATQIGGALHRVLKYAPDKILSDIATEGVSTYVNNIINFRLTVDTDIANHHIIIQNGLNTLGSLTYDNLNNTIDRTDTNYAGYGFTIYEAMQRWDYDAYNALRYGDPTLYPANSDEIRSQDPVPGTPSEAQKKVQIYIERYENAIVQLKNKLFGVNGAFYSHNKLAIENANKFELTADVQGDEWGWDSDAWDAHEYNTATETNEVKRSWDDGGNLNNLYSEFKNFSSEKDINGDRVGWHAYDFERDLGVSVEQVKYGTNFIYVYASGRPDHEHGPFPNANNPNVILNQNALWKIPLTVNIPIVKESTPLGPIGIARNGVVIYNPKDATSFLSENIWHQNAVTQEVGIDAANGHTNEKGQYHYHQNPKAMYDDNAYEHSPLLGYAWDGVPIYGPRAYPNVNGTGEIRRIRSSYRLKTGTRTAIGTETVPTGAYDGTYVEDFEYIVGLGELDQYNGRSAITPEYPNGVYAYYVTVDDLDQSVYPYIIGPEYYGIPNKENYTNTPGPVITEEISVKTRYLPNVTVDRNNRDSKGFIRPQHEQYPEEYVPVYSKEGLTVTTETHAVRVKIVDDNLLETTDGYRFASAYATVSNGAVTGLTLNHGGTGYIGPATVDIIGTVGTGATATATVDGININLLILGSGYTSAPTITFSGGSGINATAIATISNGKVVTIFVTNHGTGYTSSPTVNITGGGGSSATATAVVDAIGTLTLTAGGTGYLDLQTSMRSYYNEHGNKKVYALSDALGTTLASNIAQGDTEIQVTDVLKLPKPVAASYNRGNPVPGVIYIGSERVQYFHINEANNKLLECRRGTGTTTDQAHTSGEKIFSITDFVTLTDNIEETWSPHATYGLINSTSANARFFKENKGKAIT